MAKWLIGLVVFLNVVVAVYYNYIQTPDLTTQKVEEVSPELVSILKHDWQSKLIASDTTSLIASDALAEASTPSVVAPVAKQSQASAPMSIVKAPVANLAPINNQVQSTPKVTQIPEVLEPVKKTVDASPIQTKEVKPVVKASEPLENSLTDASEQKNLSNAAKPVNKTNPTNEMVLQANWKSQCVRWDKLTEDEKASLESQLKAVSSNKTSIRVYPQGSTAKNGAKVNIWIYYPPLTTKAETQTLSEELKSKGFDNYIVKAGQKYAGHLSLSMSNNENLANDLLRRLKKAGYGQAEVIKTGDSTTSVSQYLMVFKVSDQKTWLQLWPNLKALKVHRRQADTSCS